MCEATSESDAVCSEKVIFLGFPEYKVLEDRDRYWTVILKQASAFLSLDSLIRYLRCANAKQSYPKINALVSTPVCKG